MRRLPKVKVGDLIQYRYSRGLTRYKTTREVWAVVDDGASFVVQGGFEVSAHDVLVHITDEPTEARDDDYED